MGQCTAGSTVKGGSPAFFQFDSATVSGFLPFAAAVAWLGFLDLPVGPVATADFCVTEPPATTMSAADWLSLGIPPLAVITGAYSRLADWIKQNAFSQYCACNATTASPYAARILSLLPLFYWKLGESSGTVATDASPHGNNGTYYGSPTFGQPALITGDPATSVRGTAGIVFNAAGSTTGGGWDGTKQQSLEFWCKFTAPGATAALYTNYDGVQELMSIRTDATGHVDIQCRDTSGNLTSSGFSAASFSDGLVHQFDLIMDGANHQALLYVDAHLVSTAAGLTTQAFIHSGTNEWFLDDPHGTGVHVTGTLGHCSFWYTRGLTATEISDNRAAAGGVSPYSPQSYVPPTAGTPTAGTPPVCATSQDVCNQLYQTNLLLQGVSTQLAQFKARTQPSFWKTGTIHTGLTGSGVISVSDILAVNVLLTAVPAGWGATGETPRRLIPSAGSLQAGFASEYTDNWQVHYENELFVLSTTWATQLRYNFKPGMVATIVELSPGT